MREFRFFYGYKEKTLTEQWEDIFREYPTTINTPGLTLPNYTPITYTGTTYTPTWIVNPGLIQYTPPTYTQYVPPNYNITTTPGTGYITIPYVNTGTASGFSLTTSNTNGTTYTTAGIGGTLTTNTATFSNSAFTTNFK